MDIKSTLIQVRAWTRPIAGAASAEESATLVAAWGCDCLSCVQRLRRLRRMGSALPLKEEIFPE
jgi:hypothetical protein